MQIKRCQAEFSRPANTTAYAAGEVFSDGNQITFDFKGADGLAPAGTGINYNGKYMIKSAKLVMNSSGTTNASFDLHLYTSGVTISTADNAPFKQAYADKHVKIGKTSFTLTNPDANSDSKEDMNVDINLPFVALSANLYGVLVTTSAYTPASAEKAYLELEILTIND